MNHLEGRVANNFGLIKFVLAILVILSHSFSLLGEIEPLYGMGSEYGIGSYAVFAFLIISGHSIAESWERSSNLAIFALKRVKRIFPGLLFLYFIKLFLLSPILSTYGFFAFISHPMTFNYFLNIFFYIVPFQNLLPGLFDGKIVNGSLWTLPYEFALYFSIPIVCFYFKKFWKKTIFIFILPLLFFVIGNKDFLESLTFLQLNVGKLATFSLFFFLGILFKTQLCGINKNYVLLFFTIINIITFGKSINIIFVIFTIWYFVDVFGFSNFSYFSKLNKIGDYSYGIYIWGWFIQQIVVEILGRNISVLTLFIISSILSIQMGMISWNFVESKFSKSFYLSKV